MKNHGFFVIIIFILCTSCTIFKPEPVSEFKERSKTDILPETSTLKLKNNLPRLDGATALYPLYAAFAQAVYPPDADYFVADGAGLRLVNSRSTPWAYKNLIDGKVDIIFCAKPSDEQIEMSKEKGLDFHMTPVGRDAFVFFANKKNRVSNLTTEQIRNIYSGQITNWSELGGRKNEIKVYQRPKNSGSQTILESIMGDIDIIEPKTEDVLGGMLDIVNQTAEYRNYGNALGYSFLFYTTQMVQNNKIKLLSIDNIFPSTETIQNGTYPYTDVFYAITTNTENENVEKFINWILSEQGQYLVEKTGYVSF